MTRRRGGATSASPEPVVSNTTTATKGPIDAALRTEIETLITEMEELAGVLLGASKYARRELDEGQLAFLRYCTLKALLPKTHQFDAKVYAAIALLETPQAESHM